MKKAYTHDQLPRGDGELNCRKSRTCPETISNRKAGDGGDQRRVKEKI